MALYTIITLLSGIAPKKYIDRHTIKLKNVATLDLNLEGKVQVLGLSIAVGCGLFLLGNYGVEGNFRNDAQEQFFLLVMLLGGVALLVTALGEALLIRREIKRDEDTAGVGSRGERTSREKGGDETPITQLSSGWVGLGVVSTTSESMRVAKRQAQKSNSWKTCGSICDSS